MPEARYRIRWPDGVNESCYSPSTVVKQHFVPGQSYSVPDFVARSRTALVAASARVEAIYGTPCARAMGQLARIEQAARRFGDTPGGRVVFVAFEDDTQ